MQVEPASLIKQKFISYADELDEPYLTLASVNKELAYERSRVRGTSFAEAAPKAAAEGGKEGASAQKKTNKAKKSAAAAKPAEKKV